MRQPIGAPNLGEDPREYVDGERDWWPTSGVVGTFDRLRRSA